jgi:hypothetical protein
LRRLHADTTTPLGGILTLGALVPPLLLATWIMARIERRTFFVWLRGVRYPNAAVVQKQLHGGEV